MTSSPARLSCAYCGAPAIHMDHVVPKSLQRKYHQINGRHLPLLLRGTEPSCGPCNWRKLNRHLVPPSWAFLVDELNERVGGAEWRVWRGGVDEPAFREVHR